jgi:DNA processing protein
MELEKYWYWLHNITGIYRKKISILIDHFKCPKAVYEASEVELIAVKGMKDREIASILYSRNKWNIDEEFQKLSEKNIRFISVEHWEYPNRLKEIYDFPFGIYVKGRLPQNEKKSIAIVGARVCTNYGKGMVKEITKELVKAQVQIISGLALGLDGLAQETVLREGGETFSVLGCGVDICYPRENFDIYMKIQERGGIISEFPIGASPLPKNFPMRNRIISGMSDALIVIEAKKKSGSLITADMALEQGRDVYALPGRVNDSLSSGCNMLIKQGAGMIITVEELLEELGIEGSSTSKNKEEKKLALETNEKIVYSCLDFQPKNLQSLLDEVFLSFDEIISILLTLELKGYIVEIGKNYYAKIK